VSSNNPPRPLWVRTPIGEHTIRHTLWMGERQTPFFVDEAKVRAHYSNGHRIGLWGSGMGEEVRRRDGGTYRIAGFLGGFDRITLAKHRAEQRAMGD